jgi:CrcB protein
LRRFLLICCGGALGTGGRYLLSTWIAQTHGTGFPLGTLLINISGSFLITLIMEFSLSGGAISPNTRFFLTTGVMGGYTTYSSFNYEFLMLATHGAMGVAALYMGLTAGGALVAGFLGLAAARAILGLGARLAG